jgi:putative endonuclease
MSTQNLALGRKGEEIAEVFLRQKGFEILDKHFTSHWGEIDIIAQDHNTLVFVEVKARSGTQYGYPEEAVRPSKIHSIKRAAQFYQKTHDNLPESLRIDVVAIILDAKGDPLDVKHYIAV